MNRAAVATAIALCAAFFSMIVAMAGRSGAAKKRDPAVSFLFGVSVLVVVLYAVAAGVYPGMAFAGLLKAAAALTGMLAIAGIAFGLVRGRSTLLSTARRTATASR